MIKQDLEDLLSPLISKCGCELWGLEFSSIAGKGKVLRIFIDAIHGVDLSDCEKVSREIDDFFQFEDIFNDFQSFEVSSPGLCLLYTSPSPRDKRQSRMPSSA